MKRTELKRRTRLNPIGAKARREREALDGFRAGVMLRSKGRCEVNTPACPRGEHYGAHAHHILMRSQGGTHEPDNGLAVCADAHRYIHDHPADSYANGWLIRSWEGR